MSEASAATIRHQALIHQLRLACIGTGHCPICRAWAEIFARRRAIPGTAKECCLECWRAEH